jgi:MFS family permease
MIGALIVSAQIATIVLVPRFGPKPVVPLGMGLAAAGMALLTGLGMNSGYASAVLPALLITGLGLGLVMPPAMSLATDRIDPADAGIASATVNTMQQIGGSIGTALLNTLAASAATSYMAGRTPSATVLAQAQLHSYSTAYWWSAGFFAVGLVLTGVLYRRGRVSVDPDAPAAVHM